MAEDPGEARAPLPRESLVVRGGLVTGVNLRKGCAEHADGVYGFSVQAAPGKSVEELCQAGKVPNLKVSVTTVGALRDLRVDVISTKGRGFHATVEVPRDWAMKDADLVAAAFEAQGNPARRKP